jgi:hypothetical protein
MPSIGAVGSNLQKSSVLSIFSAMNLHSDYLDKNRTLLNLEMTHFKGNHCNLE